MVPKFTYLNIVPYLEGAGVQHLAQTEFSVSRDQDNVYHGSSHCNHGAQVQLEKLGLIARSQSCPCIKGLVFKDKKLKEDLIIGWKLRGAIESPLWISAGLYAYDLKAARSQKEELERTPMIEAGWKELKTLALKSLSGKIETLESRMASKEYPQELIAMCKKHGAGGGMEMRVAFVENPAADESALSLIRYYSKWEREGNFIILAPTLVINYLLIRNSLNGAFEGRAWSDAELKTAGQLVQDGGLYRDFAQALKSARALT